MEKLKMDFYYFFCTLLPALGGGPRVMLRQFFILSLVLVFNFPASAKVESEEQIVSKQNVIASGAIVDFNNGNVQILESVGASAITLNNMVAGASYTLIISDATSRTYTFTNCTNTHYTIANGPTTAATRSVYTFLMTTESAATHCYISWFTGL